MSLLNLNVMNKNQINIINSRTIALCVGLILCSNKLLAADRGDTDMAAAAVAGAIFFGVIYVFNSLTKKKK